MVTRADDRRAGRMAGLPLATGGAGEVLSLILSGQALSRPSLERVSGLSRATVSQRLGVLFDAGLIHEAEERQPSGGRPAKVLALNTGFAHVLAADIGESAFRVALLDLHPAILDEILVPMDVASGPAEILDEVARACRTLLARRTQTIPLLGLGLSLPAPVNHVTWRVVEPSVMRAWDDFDIEGQIGRELGLDVFSDNDVNLITLAEHRRHWPEADHFFFVKVGTGIGAGIITGDRLFRGARGVSGDVGHVQIDAPSAPLCRCGKRGCVEARAAGWAIARDLREAGFAEAHNARDVMVLVENGVPEAIQAIRESGRVLGQVCSDAVSLLNPAVIVIGGTLSQAGEHLLSGIREFVYQRCLPIAVRELTITTARLGQDAGLLGAAQFVIDEKLKPGVVDALIAAAPTRDVA